MHIALELSSDLKQLATMGIEPTFKIIMTTNQKDEGAPDSEYAVQYKEIKQAFIKQEKALVIKINEDHRVKSKFERIEHFYVLC